jgi:hypothetical protein
MITSPRALGASLLVATALTARAPAALAQPAASVELYTMGPGSDVFSRFGHAALCVRDAETPDGRCYNYGTTDFTTPIPLTWNVLRGRARFWVSVTSLDRMLAWYGPQGENRTLWRQRIELPPDALAALQQRLRDDLRPESREYVYHHFLDNCTTRLRDHLDEVTHGALRQGTDAPFGTTWRAMVLDGLASSTTLLVAGELLLGRPLDREPSRWQAMFLPAVLRTEVTRALHATPVAVFERPATPPPGSRYRGRFAIAAAALALAALSVPRPTRRIARVVGALLAGLAGFVVWTLALASSLPELSQNDLLGVLLPSDLALPFLPERPRTLYARARLVMALAASAASALGVTPQPLLAPCLFVAALMAPCAFARPAAPLAL